MKIIILTAVLFGSFLMAQEADPVKPEMITRQYFFPPTRWTQVSNAANNDPFGGDPFGGEAEMPWSRKTAGPEAMQAFFTKNYGIDFPEGSWIRHHTLGHRMVITLHNTVENHNRFRYVLIIDGNIPTNVNLSLRLVAFDAEKIDALERQNPTGVSDQAFLDLWREGEGKTVSSQNLKTLHGVNAIIEMVEEIIYPEETRIKTTDEVKTETTEFVTRDTGNILNITPTLNPDLKSVNLTVLPEFTKYKGLNPDMDEKRKSFSPLFQSLNVSSSLVVPNNGTRTLGQSTSLDGQQQLILFISAEIQVADGSPLSIEVPDAQ